MKTIAVVLALLFAYPINVVYAWPWSKEYATQDGNGDYHVTQEMGDALWSEFWNWEMQSYWDYYYGPNRGNGWGHYWRPWHDRFGDTWSKLSLKERDAFFNGYYSRLDVGDIQRRCQKRWDDEKPYRDAQEAQDKQNRDNAGGPGPM